MIDLFDSIPDNVHSGDPASSHLAAAAIEANGVRQGRKAKALELVRLYPGYTSGELSAVPECPFDLTELRRRLTDCKNDRTAVQGVMRQCRQLGTPMMVWWTADDARAGARRPEPPEA